MTIFTIFGAGFVVFLSTTIFIYILTLTVIRLSTWYLSWILAKKQKIKLKVGSVGFFSIRQICLQLDGNISVECEVCWISSRLFHSKYKSLFAICIGDVRLQGNVLQLIQLKKTIKSENHISITNTESKTSQILSVLKKVSLHVYNASVISQLGSPSHECLLHSSIAEVTVVCGRNQNAGEEFGLQVNSASIKVFKHDPQSGVGGDPCLAQLSLSLMCNLVAKPEESFKIKSLAVAVLKPEVMFYEGVPINKLKAVLTEAKLTNTSDIRDQDRETESNTFQTTETSQELVGKQSTLNEMLQKIPEVVEIKFLSSSVKLMREAGQRTLTVTLQLIQAELKQDFSSDAEFSSLVTSSLSLQDLVVTSGHTKFTSLAKSAVKINVHHSQVEGKRALDSSIQLSSLHVDHHHDELYYWLDLLPASASKNTAGKKSKFLPQHFINESLQLHLSIELEDILVLANFPGCCPFGAGLTHSRVTTNCFVDVSDQIHNSSSVRELSVELLFEMAWCRVKDKNIFDITFQKKCHQWNTPIGLGMILFKVRDYPTDFKIQCMVENLQAEWNPDLANLITKLTPFFKTDLNTVSNLSNVSSSAVETNVRINHSSRITDKSFLFHTLQLSFKNTSLYAVTEDGPGLIVQFDSVTLDTASEKLFVSLEGVKMITIASADQPVFCQKSPDIKNSVLHLKTVHLTYKNHSKKEVNLQLLDEITGLWSTDLHMMAFTLAKELLALKTFFKAERKSSEPKINGQERSPFVIHVRLRGNVHFGAVLSSTHRMSVQTLDFTANFHPQWTSAQTDHLVILFDECPIFSLTELNVSMTSEGERHLVNRQSFEGLEKKQNKAMIINTKEVKVVFPYQYNFAEIFNEQAIGIVKWLKLIHKKQKKPFTLESPLPPDLVVKVKFFSVEISDDIFEVKLKDNYALLEDEYNESLKRKKMLDEKLENLRKTNLLLPLEKVEELYNSLAKKNADIYVQRSRLLYHNADLKTPLITWTFEGVDFVVVADTSYHGTDRVVQVMKEIDEESPFPEEGVDFTTLWCRRVRGSMQAVICQLRNYPQTLLEIKEFHVWGRLVGAEQEAAPRAKRTTVIQVGEPWGDMTVERNMPSLKFYHELNCDIESFCSAYGPCWEPIMAQVNLSMENISKPSADPSLSLPWWDKARLLLHGRLTMSIQHLTFLMHASLDPYNMMEQMEMTWSDVIIDWTNAKIMMQGDLDIYVHTASKYDDCRLLHIPNLKFSVKLDWACLANPNDHHVVMPCAPDKIPEYSSNQVHDSYRAFRSQQLNMSLSIETKPVALETSSDIPTMLLYSSTLRWLENLKVILSGVPKLTRRGILFNNVKSRKVPLSRHYRNVRLSVNFHKFQVCYWMSFTKQRGFELLGGRLSLSSEHTLALTPLMDGLIHRARADWRIAYMNCELRDSEIWLYRGSMDDKEIDANKSFRGPVDRNYFLSVTRVSYGREASIKDLLTEQDMEDTPTHRLVVHGLKGAWTKHNRDVVFFLFDSYIKATLLKRNLSTEALKCFKLESQATPVKSKNMIPGSSSVSQAATPSPMTRLQSGHAASMLQKLIAEAEASSVVFTEDIEGGTNEQQLHGVAACQTDDVLHKNWLIELVNSQVMLRGCETSGYVIVSASKAQILQRIHRHTWKERTLVSKTTWVGSLECMQYYATVDAGDPSPSFDNVMWLTVDNIEAQKDSMVISDLADLVGSGHSVGGVVSSTVGGASDPTSAPLQLQRIVSRCGCQFFYASYGENVDPSTLEEVHPPPTHDDPWDQEVAVDSFTLTHHDLDICTNSLQYAMILDLVNNLLLYVEPRKKEASEKLQRMRFQLQLCSVDDQKGPILQLQNQVRSLVFNLRRLEKEAYLAQKALEENPSREDLAEDLEQLEKEIYSCKEQINFASEELAMMISCFKELHVSATKQRQLATARESGEDVVRRSEMCFKHAQWRLTDADGLLGIADLVLSNFLYSKITKNDDSVEHLLELGYFKVTNLLPNQLYKDVLQPTELQPNIPVDRQQALRIFCRDRAPVGGISVKEHLEVNVIPITIGLTYAFFTTMLKFFFPERATEKTEEHGYEEQDNTGTLSRQKKRTTLSNRSTPTSIDRDDIDKMKERAAQNHTFLYIKIPEVPIRVSYKGEKEKNIEDLHDCSLMLPTLEYHNRTWTWLDLLLEMKNDSKRVLLSQAIKQKLQIKSSKTSLDESSQPQEEDKARLLLGSKLTGGPEKGNKKGLFGKSNK